MLIRLEYVDQMVKDVRCDGFVLMKTSAQNIDAWTAALNWSKD